HSIPNNNDNQDSGSMGCNAALITKKVIDNAFEVLAIQMMTVLQAIDYLDCVDRLSPTTKAIYTVIRQVFPTFVEDLPKYKDLERIKTYVENSDPVITVRQEILAANNGSPVTS